MTTFNNTDFPQVSHADWETNFESKKTTTSQLPYQEFTGILKQSPGDKRKYRLIRLPNNLVALCAHDADAEQAAVSLCVHVGSNGDSPELQGMAHFLEHMLFMGSKKYPAEDAYFKYMSNHSGYANAGTYFEKTDYHFKVDNGALEGALDMLSQVLTQPALNANAVDREINAVNSEFVNSIINDYWRTEQMYSLASNPNHPYSQFQCGNVESLKDSAKELGLDLRSKVKKFFDQYYSSDIMKLCIISNHSLGQLTEWTASMFSGIESKGDTRPKYTTTHPLGRTELGRIIRYEPHDEDNRIHLLFSLPDISSSYFTYTVDYISQLVSAKGPGSLVSYLIEQQLATSVFFSCSPTVTKGFSIGKIFVSATPQGIENYQKVVGCIFSYLDMLVKLGPQKWYYDQLNYKKSIDFQYYTNVKNIDLATLLTKGMCNSFKKPEQVLLTTSFEGEYNPEYISALLSLLNPTNYTLLVESKKHQGPDCNSIEKYYGIKYNISDLPASLTSKTNVGDSALYGFHMPQKNRYLPKNLIPIQQPSPAQTPSNPVLLKKDEIIEVWFKKDDQFFDLRGSINMTINIPEIASSRDKALLCIAYYYYVIYYLSEEFDDAADAGYSFDVTTSLSTLDIIISGYSENIIKLLSDILKKMSSMTINDRLYRMLYKKLVDYYDYYDLGEAYHLVSEKQYMMTAQPYWSGNTFAKLLKTITSSQLQKFADDVFKNAYIKLLVSGYYEEKDGLMIANIIQDVLKPSILPTGMHSRIHCVQLEDGHYIHHTTSLDKTGINNAVVRNIHCGPMCDSKLKMTSKLLVEIASQPFFNQLRTKEQLGYISTVTYAGNHDGDNIISILVQDKGDPTYATLRINNFLCEFRNKLVEYDLDTLQKKKNTMAIKLKEKTKNVEKEASKFMKHISTGIYDFDSVVNDVEELLKLDKQNLLAFWDRYISPSAVQGKIRWVDCVAWSSNSFQPTEQMLKEYSSFVIALYGLLHNAGLTSVAITDINNLVTKSTNDDSVDSILGCIKMMYKDSAGYTAVFDGESQVGTCIRTAIKMALENVRSPAPYTVQNGRNYENIGMYKTFDGRWMVTDIDKFKATQQLYGQPIPVHNMIPKY